MSLIYSCLLTFSKEKPIKYHFLKFLFSYIAPTKKEPLKKNVNCKFFEIEIFGIDTT